MPKKIKTATMRSEFYTKFGKIRRNSMDIFAPIVGGLILLAMIVDHMMLSRRIDRLEEEVKRWELLKH